MSNFIRLLQIKDDICFRVSYILFKLSRMLVRHLALPLLTKLVLD